MARERLVQQAVDQVIDRIVRGEYAAGHPLPAQTELAQELEVSRLTVREAIETLRSRGILEVVHGSGTFVCPTEQWTDADAISRLVGKDDAGERVSLQLLEVRRMLEIGASELCAERRSDADVDELGRLLGLMRSAHAEADVDTFVTADMDFHAVVLRGCRNPFLAVVYEPLMRVLRRTRAQTSDVPAIREHAIVKHAEILESVRTGDGTAARHAMADHMAQTSADLRAYVLDRQD